MNDLLKNVKKLQYVLFAIGTLILVFTLGFWATLGVYLILWANNLQQGTRLFDSISEIFPKVKQKNCINTICRYNFKQGIDMNGICSKCNTNPVNATGIMCDACMLNGNTVVNAPVQQEQKVELPTMTHEEDNFDSYTKSFDDGLVVKVTVNYTKAFSEITVYKNDALVNTRSYTDKETFEADLSSLLEEIKKQEEEKKRREEEKKQYFEDIKSIVGDFGFDEE